ncbi:PAS domain-containing protein [Agrobacterium sp. T29]|uniref:PAS domain-containing protein n=1 Tax=Agrobacterium sp. T29 TaxID=2580515 RepID=UPI001FEE9FFD|nr:PAS domain-containing protein [Agrobacterium sp. T29]
MIDPNTPIEKNHWQRGQLFPFENMPSRPDEVDGPEYRELAENLPTLCWIANADGYITWYNRRWHEYCGTTSEQMEGWGWQSVHDPAVLPRVIERWTASIASGNPFEMVFPLRGADGIFRPFLTRIIPLRDEAGIVRRWIGNNIDIGSQVSVEQELRRAQDDLLKANRALEERESFLTSVLAASTDCIKVIELDGTLSFMSEGGMKVMEISDFNLVRGCPWPDLLTGQSSALARDAIDEARRGRSSHFEMAADTYMGNPRWWSVSVSPIIGKSGDVARILSVSRDHTALKDAQEKQRLLNGELDHRLKNMLAIVQSVAGQTMRDAKSLEEASASLSARLASLGHATQVLTATSWQSAELHDVVTAGLSAVSGIGTRIAVEGPRITLTSQAVMALTLALHELATNALKYGALSNEEGSISLRWSVTRRNGEAHFSLLWQERNGPVVTPPARLGFGSRLIERSLQSYFRGETILSYLSEGVEFRIDAPLGDTGELVNETGDTGSS